MPSYTVTTTGQTVATAGRWSFANAGSVNVYLTWTDANGQLRNEIVYPGGTADYQVGGSVTGATRSSTAGLTVTAISTASPGGAGGLTASGGGTITTTAEVAADAALTATFAPLGGATTVSYDVVVAIGQSNMSGGAADFSATRYDAIDSRIYQWPRSGSYASQLSLAAEPLDHPDATTFQGAALQFSRWLADSQPAGRRVLIIPAAYGGTGFSTSGASSWDPAGSGNLYTLAISQANAAIAYLNSAGITTRVSAFIWIQGEADVAMTGTAYAAKLDALIAGMRAGITGASATTPFIVGQLCPEFSSGTSAQINAAHAATPGRVSYTAYAAGLAGSNKGDNTHYNAAGQRYMGRSMWLALASAKANAPGPPAAPTALSAQLGGSGQIALSWTAPVNTGGSAITDYIVEYKLTANSTWLTFADGTSTTTSATVTGLVNGLSYDFRVSAVTAVGTGATSSTATFTPQSSFVLDTFTGAGSTTITSHTGEIGATWLSSGVTPPNVTGGQLVFAGTTVVTASGVAASANYSVTADIRLATVASGLGSFAGVGARTADATAGVGSILGYWLVYDNSQTIVLNKGLSANIGSAVTPSGGLSTSVTYRFTVTVSGTTISGTLQRLSDNFYLTSAGAWQAGAATCCTTTDSTYTTAGKTGIYTGASQTGGTLDNFTAS